MNFTVQNIVIYDPFHLKNDVILMKIMGFTLLSCALNSFNLHNKPPCLHPLTSNAPKQITKNITKKQQEVSLQQTAYVYGKILPR